jgi:hypothetical protein
MRARTTAAVLAAAAAALALPAAASTRYAFTVTPAASSVSTTFSASAPLTGTIIGDTAATPPTRTRVGANSFFPPSFVTCTPFGATQNDPINISGTLAANSSQGGNQPAGAFTFALDTTAGTSAVEGLDLNLLGTSTFTVAATISQFTYQNICAVNPTCALRFLTPISLPLGDITVTTIRAQQPTGSASGTLTPTGPSTYDFSIPLLVDVTVAAAFSGSPITQPPQSVPVVFAGSVSVSGASATITSSLNIAISPPPNTTPTSVGPAPLATPADSALCPGLNLILTGTVTSTALSSSTTGTVVAGGTVLCPCDITGDNALSPSDIFAFLNLYFAGDPRGDFDGNGVRQPADIFAYLNCYFARPAGCSPAPRR